jgi:hypothetical protein
MLVQHTWKRTKAGATYVEADGAGNEHDIAVQRGIRRGGQAPRLRPLAFVFGDRTIHRWMVTVGLTCHHDRIDISTSTHQLSLFSCNGASLPNPKAPNKFELVLKGEGSLER